MAQENIDKMLKKYWDYRFNNAYFGNSGTEYNWYGLHDSNGGLIAGHITDKAESLYQSKNRQDIMDQCVPTFVTYEYWIADGYTFGQDWGIFNITSNEFYKSMRNYINEKYNMSIKHIV